MNFKKAISAVNRLPLIIALTAIALVGCGSSDKDTPSGYLQFYNASYNAPAIAMLVKVDDNEKTHGPAVSGESTNYFQTAPGNYTIDLLYVAASELETLLSIPLDVNTNYINLLVLVGDVTSPTTLDFNFPVDDPEPEEDIFNTRVLNLHNSLGDIEIYFSKSTETFAEAELLESVGYGLLSESSEHDLDNYIFYITLAGSDEVLYESEIISFAFTSQYVLAIRENIGYKERGDSPFTIDRISSATGALNFPSVNSVAQSRIYNGLVVRDEFEGYAGTLDLHIDGEAKIEALATGEFSDTLTLDSGDYSVDVFGSTETPLITSSLLTLASGNDKTSFIYLAETDEYDEDGEFTETVYTPSSLVVDNSQRASVLDHKIQIINLVDVDDFSVITLYFLRNNETVDSALFQQRSRYAETSTNQILPNNTYTIRAVVTKGTSRQLIASIEDVTLDQTSKEMFLIIEQKDPMLKEYSLTLVDQKPSTDG